MRRLTWLGLVLALWALAPDAWAQVRVRKSAGEKSSIDLSGFRAPSSGPANVFFRTLQNDLVRSGWFTFARQGGGEFRVLGSSEERRGRVDVKCEVYGTAGRKRYMSKSYGESAGVVRRLAHRVADDIVEALTGRRGIASTKIVMVGTRTKKKELYLCDADGNNLEQLTRDKTVCLGANWGPRAERILYTSFFKRYPDVYLIHLASGRRDRIAKFPGLNTGAAMSPDGRDITLILSKDGNPELYIMNLASKRLTRVTRTRNAAEASPCWAPDGQRIAYVSDSSGRPQVYLVSRNGGRPRRITSRGSENVAPDWGPGGLIAYSSRVGGRYQVAIMDPRTLESKYLALDHADYEDPSWAPDGRHIACSRTERYRSKVYILDTAGDRPLPLTDYQGDWYSPAWSPR